MSTRLLTAAEVAAMLGVPKSWVYEQSRQGRIPTVALGHYRRFRPEAIAAWVDQLEAASARLPR
jgi:excisionase family DNA binding protein